MNAGTLSKISIKPVTAKKELKIQPLLDGYFNKKGVFPLRSKKKKSLLPVNDVLPVYFYLISGIGFLGFFAPP